MRKLLLAILLISFSVILRGQEYGYTQYSVREGLAGATVYCMQQATIKRKPW